jgi:ATP-dependent DNA helicase RecQ
VLFGWQGGVRTRTRRCVTPGKAVRGRTIRRAVAKPDGPQLNPPPRPGKFPPMSAPDLLPPLKQYFGFSSFRPLQEAIIRDALAGKDVFALLPTGGGKSLCFQMPALVAPGLTVVVSPLIALMKDQVDALQAAGVPATFLNSSLGAGESRPRLRGLHQGEFRLLYVAPERLMLSGFLEDLQRWNVRLIAVDEAHCISEWGHDFRPEYRQLANLRGLFPDVPFMALTATATERVRADIVEQLHLRSPATYVASFNRPNLTYRVSAKQGAYRQVLDFIRAPGRARRASSTGRAARAPRRWPRNSARTASWPCRITPA